MRVQAILFDKDGTLFDFHKTWSPWVGQVIRDLARGEKMRETALAQAWDFDLSADRIGPQSIVIAGEVHELAEAILPHLPDHNQGSLLRYLLRTSAQASGVEVVALAPFLTDLANRGLKLGLATNDAESVARAQLRRVAAEAHFDFLAGYDSGYGGKPAPGMCLAFAAHTGIAPERILMVGDSAHDIEAGRAAGMQVMAVLTGVAEQDDLAHLTDTILPDISHLPAWLAG